MLGRQEQYTAECNTCTIMHLVSKGSQVSCSSADPRLGTLGLLFSLYHTPLVFFASKDSHSPQRFLYHSPNHWIVSLMTCLSLACDRDHLWDLRVILFMTIP